MNQSQSEVKTRDFCKARENQVKPRHVTFDVFSHWSENHACFDWLERKLVDPDVVVIMID